MAYEGLAFIDYPLPPNQGPVTYNQINTLLGLSRGDLGACVNACRSGDPEALAQCSDKGRYYGYQALLLDAVWQRYQHWRQEKNPACGLGHVAGLAAIPGKPGSIATMFMEEASPVADYGIVLRSQVAHLLLHPLPPASLDWLQQEAQKSDEAYEAAIELVAELMMHPLQSHLLALDSDIIADEFNNQHRVNAQTMAVAQRYKKEAIPANYPHYESTYVGEGLKLSRTMMKGLVFGPEFGMAIISKFRHFATAAGKPWNRQTAEALSDALQKFLKAFAQRLDIVLLSYQGLYLKFQREVLHKNVKLVDVVECRWVGDQPFFRMKQTLLWNLLQNLQQTRGHRDFVEQILQNRREILGCSASASVMFDGVLDWQKEVCMALAFGDGDPL